MKTNKFLLGILTAGAMFASCSNELPGNEQPENGGKAEKSFMSVAIKQANSSFTRSTTDGGYAQGTDQENAVGTLSFFFFKSDGSAFNLGTGIVNAHGSEEAEGDTPNGTGAINEAQYDGNLYEINTPGGTDQNNNVDREYGATLVIEHNVGNIPAAIVAVINHPNPQSLKNMSITGLQQEILDSQPTSANFVMCNSVYKNAAGIAMETPITAANLGKNEQEAKDNPVDIYVERVAARVDVKAAFTTTPNSKGAYPVGKTIKFSDGTEAEVYAQILGWDINTYADKTNLIKDISGNESWNLGWTWNNAADFRSYWADNVTGLTTIKNFTWKDLHGTVNALNGTDYCYENTTTPQKIEVGGVYNRVESRKENTKVLVKAEIQDKAGNVLKFANWYGQNYKADSDNSYTTFKGVVANSLKNKLVKGNGGTYTPITAADFELRQGTGTGTEDSYKVYFEFTTTAQTENWYYLDNGTYIAYADGEAAKALRATEPARIWNGMAYYFVNIEHLGAVGETTDGLDTDSYIKGYYGVVRNHAYELTLTDISGLGTPVFNGTTEIPYPVEPDLTESFIAAKIKVLAWKWIKKDVVLGE